MFSGHQHFTIKFWKCVNVLFICWFLGNRKPVKNIIRVELKRNPRRTYSAIRKITKKGGYRKDLNKVSWHWRCKTDVKAYDLSTDSTWHRNFFSFSYQIYQNRRQWLSLVTGCLDLSDTSLNYIFFIYSAYVHNTYQKNRRDCLHSAIKHTENKTFTAWDILESASKKHNTMNTNNIAAMILVDYFCLHYERW